MERKLVGMFLMDVKGAFDHVSRNGLMRKTKALGADRDLVRWTGFFIVDRKVSLIVDCHQCEAVEVEKGVLQGLPVSHILLHST